MGILDEAIKEHLELKRQHGAADSELKQLEDEAFGPPERPGDETTGGDALTEAPTEFMAVPEAGAGKQRQESAIADLQEAPPPSEPAEEEQPAAEHEAVAEPEPATDEDRQAIAEQPTEHFDVEEELAGSARPGPSDEELIEEEMDEPRLAPVDPLADLEEVEEVQITAEAAPGTVEDEDEEEDDFWNEQRLSEELDQALDAPLAEDRPQAAEAEAEVAESEPAEETEDDEEAAVRDSDPDSDVLEKTPDFLEDAPEDDELWFEQKPPKDFDFDD